MLMNTLKVDTAGKIMHLKTPKLRKRLLKISVFIGIFLAVGLFGTFLFIRSENFLRWAETRLEQELQDRITDDYTADIGSIEGNILGSITVENLRISQRDQPIISTGEVHLKYNLIGLLTRKFEVNVLTVDQLEIRIRRNTDGTFNLSDILKKETAEPRSTTTTTTQTNGASFGFAIETLQFTDGIIDYVDTQRDLNIGIQGVSIGLNGLLNTWNHDGTFSINSGVIRVNGAETPIDNFDADFHISATGTTLDNFQLKFGNSDVSITGGFNTAETDPAWNAELNLSVDLAEVTPFFSKAVQLAGVLEAELALNGTDSTFAGSLALDMPTLSAVRAPDKPEIAVEALHLEADFNSEPAPVFTLKTLTAKVAAGALTANGSIAAEKAPEGDLLTQFRRLRTDPVRYSGEWQASDVQFLPLLSMFMGIPDKLVGSTGLIASTGNFTGDFTDAARLDLRGDVSLTDATLNGVEVGDSALACRVAAGELKIDGNFQRTAIHVSGPFSVPQEEPLDVRLSEIDFGNIMEIADSAKLGGTGEFTGHFADRTLYGFVEVPDANFNGSPLGLLTGDLRYKDRRLFIENGLLTKNTKKDLLTGEEVITEYQSRATINGTVLIKDKYPADFSVIAEPAYVQHYPKVLLGAEYPVDGEIRGELKLYGSMLNLDGNGTFSVTEGVAWNVRLDPLTLPLDIEGYSITIPDFKITTRGQQVTLNVNVASNADYDFLLVSDAPVRLEEIATAADIPEFPFEGEVEVHVLGTLRKPAAADFTVELRFADLTFLHSRREIKYPLGDAYLLGKLIEQEETTGNPNYFDFHGHGFQETADIQGYVSLAKGNPYQFTAESDAFDVTPILPIVNPLLEPVTGTGAGAATIVGRIADFAASADSEAQRIYPYDVDILVTDSYLHYEYSRDRRLPFTNADPIRLNLRDDIWTIAALSLRTPDADSPFAELTGTLNAQTETMDMTAVSDAFDLAPFGSILEPLQTGTARYNLEITGNPLQPVFRLTWHIPTLTLQTEGTDIDISDAEGTIVYRNDLMQVEKCVFNLFGNQCNVEGEVTVEPETIDASQLKLRLDTVALDLATLPIETPQAGPDEGLTGMLEVSVVFRGTFAEPHFLVYVETVEDRLIHFTPYFPTIAFERFHVDASLDAENLHIRFAEANGQMGLGSFRAEGEATFSLQNRDTMQFTVDISASEVEVADYGIASGDVKISGTGLTPDEMVIVGEISTVALDGYNFQLVNTAPLRFRSNPLDTEKEPLAVHIPLEITAPAMTASLNVNIGGTLEAPSLTAEWNGTLNRKEWRGNIGYNDKRITLHEIALTQTEETLSLTGVIPFDLALRPMEMSQRFLETPLDVRLQGSEVSLDFFPGVNSLFSEAAGTVDIDIALQGTSRRPHIAGDVSVEAPHLQFKGFHEAIRNLKLQFKATEGAVDISQLQFDIGTGYSTFQQGRLAVDGLVPTDLTLTGLRFEMFPLATTFQELLPPDLFQDIQGHLSTSLTTLKIPLDTFVLPIGDLPLPRIQKIPSLMDIVAVAEAEVSIKSVRLAFNALDRHYDFQDPHPIRVFLNGGTVTLSQPFKLENQYAFSLKQTFTDEDTKPEGLVGNERTFSAKTFLSIDAGAIWSVDGAFKSALRFRNFDVSAITHTWPAAYRVVGGLSGTLQISGTSTNPKITLRRHESEPAELYLHDAPIDLRWRIRYQNEKWEITEKRYLEIRLGENQLTFSWVMPYHLELIPLLMALQESPEQVWVEFQQSPMHGTLDIEIENLDILPSVIPGLTAATGTGEAHLKLTGTLQAPEANGSVLLNSIGFRMPEARISAEDIEAKIGLSEVGASIQQLTGVLNDGRFSVNGSIAAPVDKRIWEKPPTVDLSASLASTVFEQPGQYRIDLDSTELRFHGGLMDPRLTGNLYITGGYYQQNWEIVRDWLTGVSVKETELVLNYPILRDLYLDALNINISENFRVLSSITGPTDIEIACFGKLVGPINQPVFSGNVSVLNGKIGLVAQTFEFMEGSTISNQSTVDFNPALNLSMRTLDSIRGVMPRDQSTVDIQVYASVTGTLKNPNFVLSAPPETTTEVLTHGDIMTFLIQNAALSGAFGGLTFSVYRPLDEDARYISAEYPLGKNVSIKLETNEDREHGIDIELKGRF